MFTDGSVEVTAEGIVSDDIDLSFLRLIQGGAATICRRLAATAETCRTAGRRADWLPSKPCETPYAPITKQDSCQEPQRACRHALTECSNRKRQTPEP